MGGKYTKGSVALVVLTYFALRFRYPIKIMASGTDNKLLDQKMYFANGGVFTVIIQPNPDKAGKVRISFLNKRILLFWVNKVK